MMLWENISLASTYGLIFGYLAFQFHGGIGSDIRHSPVAMGKHLKNSTFPENMNWCNISEAINCRDGATNK